MKKQKKLLLFKITFLMKHGIQTKNKMIKAKNCWGILDFKLNGKILELQEKCESWQRTVNNYQSDIAGLKSKLNTDSSRILNEKIEDLEYRNFDLESELSDLKNKHGQALELNKKYESELRTLKE